MKIAAPFVVLAFCVLGLAILPGGSTSPRRIGSQSTPEMKESAGEQSIRMLKEGNDRYRNGKMITDHNILKKRADEKLLHEPIAVILGCCDARTPPEIIFDQSVGDLFVVRVIGNIVGTLQMDSIEYASHILHAPLIMVMGHQDCGAVRAVMEGKAKEEDEEHIIPFIEPAIRESKDLPGDKLTNAIKANINLAVNTLRSSEVLQPLIQEGKLKIMGGYYSIETGGVEFFECPLATTPLAPIEQEP